MKINDIGIRRKCYDKVCDGGTDIADHDAGHKKHGHAGDLSGYQKHEAYGR